jgi:hypothetical protein
MTKTELEKRLGEIGERAGRIAERRTLQAELAQELDAKKADLRERQIAALLENKPEPDRAAVKKLEAQFSDISGVLAAADKANLGELQALVPEVAGHVSQFQAELAVEITERGEEVADTLALSLVNLVRLFGAAGRRIVLAVLAEGSDMPCGRVVKQAASTALNMTGNDALPFGPDGVQALAGRVRFQGAGDDANTGAEAALQALANADAVKIFLENNRANALLPVASKSVAEAIAGLGVK